jgi:hypothetical protein
MGIRSILGLGGSKDRASPRGDGDDFADDDDDTTMRFDDADDLSSSANSQAAPASFLQPPLRMGEDPVSKEVNVLTLDHRETTQERINRVKAGHMTEAEKKAFLRTALTAGNTPESRLPLVGDGDAATGSAAGNGNSGNARGGGGKRFFASPFPSDSILRNFARGSAGPGSEVSPASDLDSQKKKREYLDMVTDPDRFKKKKASLPKAPAQADEADDDDGPDASFGGDDAPDEVGEDARPFAAAQGRPPPAAPSAPSDLGARLGMAAMANESIRRQQDQDRKKEMQWRLEAERRQHEQRAKELNEWQQRMAGFEAQQRELRAREEERRLEQDAEKRREEQARLEHLVRAQEEYWEKKLAGERAARLQGAGASSTGSQEEQEPAGAAATEGVRDAATASAQEEKSDSTPVNEKSPVPSPATGFNPDESDLLNLVSGRVRTFFRASHITSRSHRAHPRSRSRSLGKEGPRRRLGREPGANGTSEGQDARSEAVLQYH